jgi:hypothetical protein
MRLQQIALETVAACGEMRLGTILALTLEFACSQIAPRMNARSPLPGNRHPS